MVPRTILKSRETGRGERIRTSGPCLPKTVLYQAELLPDRTARRLPGARQRRPYRCGAAGWQAGKWGGSAWSWPAPSRPHDSDTERHWEWQYLDLMRRIWSGGDERHRPDRRRHALGVRDDVALRLVRRARAAAHHQAGVLESRRARDAVVPHRRDQHPAAAAARRDDLERLAARQIPPRDRRRHCSQEDFERASSTIAGFAARWGDLGPVYGKQWVDWPTYEPAGDGHFRRGAGINQVAQVVESLRANPGSRRHIIEGWNVAELDRMALPPCHKTYQFHVADGRLSARSTSAAATWRSGCRSTCSARRC